MTEFELIFDFHKNADRQGPGSDTETLKALNMFDIKKSDNLNIADIGCGSGSQTIILARNTNGHITAVDIFPGFLENINIKAEELNLKDTITTVERSMDDLQFGESEFDLIWSEGAVYNMGFKNALKAWRPFLKKGGYLAVSEISWITDSRPEEIENYWMKAYEQIDTISGKIRTIEAKGYSPLAHFILPEYCWTDNYYRPMENRFESFLEKHGNSDSAKEMIRTEKEEIRLYKKYKNYYGYVFYLAQKI